MKDKIMNYDNRQVTNVLHEVLFLVGRENVLLRDFQRDWQFLESIIGKEEIYTVFGFNCLNGNKRFIWSFSPCFSLHFIQVVANMHVIQLSTNPLDSSLEQHIPRFPHENPSWKLLCHSRSYYSLLYLFLSVTQLHSTSLEKRQELLSSESVASSV